MGAEARTHGSSDVAGLRADARRNREHLLVTARAVFVERGLEASTSQIARRAGLGVATLYRHFPTRADLVAAVFTDRVESCVSCVLQASRDPDPWRGFSAAIEGLCTIDVDCRGLTSAFLAAVPGGASGFDHQRRAAERAFADLVRRAKGSGQLRADFAREDLSLALTASAGLVHGATSRRVGPPPAGSPPTCSSPSAPSPSPRPWPARVAVARAETSPARAGRGLP